MKTVDGPWNVRASAVLSAVIDRCFDNLRRAKLVDVERLLADSANERELSQRVHRLESGEFPLNA
jgi:hypothetical protein